MRTRIPLQRRANCRAAQSYQRHPVFCSHPVTNSKFKVDREFRQKIFLPKVSAKHSLHIGSPPERVYEGKLRLTSFSYTSIFRVATKPRYAQRIASLYNEKIYLLVLMLYLYGTSEVTANEQ